MSDHKLIDIECTLKWKSHTAEHTDIVHLHKVNLETDKLPINFAEEIAKLKKGESCSLTYKAKDILGEDFSTYQITTFKVDLFDNNFKGQHSPPNLYRFYPSAIAWQGLNTESSDYTPFRLISINDENMIADQNHPLAKYYLTLSALKVKESNATKNNKKKPRDIVKLITSKGPGMQVPFEFGDPVFFEQYPFTSLNNNLPTKPQLDSVATDTITDLYSQLLPKHSKVLDLMSGQDSYLADDYETGLLSGIGINEEELNKNQRLDTYQIQHLNSDAILPFEENSFDDAICTLSIEYLSNPLEIIKEVARVVNSGGKFIIIFSNNKSSPETISLWKQLHPFEKLQLVLEYFRQSNKFIALNTFSNREMLDSGKLEKKHPSHDVFAVWGNVN